MSIPGLLILAALNTQAQQGSPAGQQVSPMGQQTSPMVQQTQGGSANGGAQAIHTFSLPQAVDYAAHNSVKVKNALLDYQIQEQSNKAVTSEALPQVSGSAGFTD